MARTNKVGINYFSFDVDFFNDPKIEFTSAKFGTKGEIIAIRLLCKIYRDGYFTEWNEDESILLAKRVADACTFQQVNEVVAELVKRGMFDKTIFDKYGVLTSNGIQTRYFEATRRYKSVEVFREYLLCSVTDYDNVIINDKYVDIIPINDDINPQKKGKEKEKENKEKILKKKFAEFVLMSQDEYDKLASTHGEEDTQELISILNNYKGANGKHYKSDYLAILNWVVARLKENKLKSNGKFKVSRNRPDLTDVESGIIARAMQ